MSLWTTSDSVLTESITSVPFCLPSSHKRDLTNYLERTHHYPSASGREGFYIKLYLLKCLHIKRNTLKERKKKKKKARKKDSNAVFCDHSRTAVHHSLTRMWASGLSPPLGMFRGTTVLLLVSMDWLSGPICSSGGMYAGGGVSAETHASHT